jgi:hypothetical protein
VSQLATPQGAMFAGIAIGTDGIGELAVADAGAPAEITGIVRGSKEPFHVIDRILGRDGHGVSNDAMMGAIKNTSKVARQANGTFRLIGKNAVVVVNKTGKIVTTWARNSNGWRH